MSSIRFPSEFFAGYLGAGNAGIDEIQNPTRVHTPINADWRGEQNESDKTECFQFVRDRRYNGHITRLSEAVKHVYGPNYSNTEYKRLSTFAERTEWLEIERKASGFVKVEPSVERFNEASLLNSCKAKQKNARGRKDSSFNDETGAKTGMESTDHSTESIKSHKNRLRGILDNTQLIRSDSLRNDCLGQLTAWRESVADTYSIFKSTKWWKKSNNYLILPYLSRFNDSGRARDTLERLYTSLKLARCHNDIATLLTLTVDPKRTTGNTSALELLRESWGKLRSRLKYQLGESVSMTKVLEWQENGMPHFHVVLYGVRKVDVVQSRTGETTISTKEVRQWWDDDYDVGSQIYVQPVTKSRDRWLLHDGDRKVSLRYYLGKASRRLVELASMTETQLRNEVESGNVHLWKQALYWVHEERYITCSPCLKESNDDDDGLPHVTEWEYIGSARFHQIPNSVVENAVIGRRGAPPPKQATGGGGSPSVATT